MFPVSVELKKKRFIFEFFQTFTGVPIKQLDYELQISIA